MAVRRLDGVVATAVSHITIADGMHRAEPKLLLHVSLTVDAPRSRLLKWIPEPFRSIW